MYSEEPVNGVCVILHGQLLVIERMVRGRSVDDEYLNTHKHILTQIKVNEVR